MTNFESKLKEEIKEYFEGATFSNVSYRANAEGHFEAGAQWAFEELNAKILLLERENKLAVKSLQAVKSFLENAPLESGVCCCGDTMAKHTPRFDAGHEPVDSGAYAIASEIKFIADIVSTLTKSKGDAI